MTSRTNIKLAYKKIIDSSVKTEFERNVFDDTYAELLLQSNVYNREKKFTTVAEMILANPKGNSLHYKVGFAIGLYVNQLGKKMPELVDNLNNPVHFDIFKTDIIYSDLTDKSKHVVAITFITSPLRLITSVGNYLVLANLIDEQPTDGLETFTVELQPNLSVIHFQEV
ncbi:MAG: hypothetical protein QM734_00750 [Cyclobacteriaceae bacterium]